MKKNDSLHVEISIFQVEESPIIKRVDFDQSKQLQTRESLRGTRGGKNEFREISSSQIKLDARS